MLQIFAAVELTGYLSLRNGRRAVNDLASQLRSNVTPIPAEDYRTKSQILLSHQKIKQLVKK